MNDFDGIARFDGGNRICFKKSIIKKANIYGNKTFVVKVLNENLILVPAQVYFNDQNVIKKFDEWIRKQLVADDKVLQRLLFGE